MKRYRRSAAHQTHYVHSLQPLNPNMLLLMLEYCHL
jgi:hypothetical protein